jgi:hypothetical protein
LCNSLTGLNDQFPDPAVFQKWDWGIEDDHPIGPYTREENWYFRQTLDWAQLHLRRNTFPRGDYRELCELINFVLGGEVSNLKSPI